MPITQASEHEVSGLSLIRYCGDSQVLHRLRGVARDTANQSLGEWLSGGERDELITELITEVRFWIEQQANRDFDYHEDVDVVLDGSGEDVMHLDLLGFAPLLSVSALAINGTAKSLDNYVYYKDGRFTSERTGEKTTWNLYHAPIFPAGTQNVEMTLTWGYAICPLDIQMAQARKVAAEVLADLQAVDTQSGDIDGGLQRVSYGDLQITVGAKGKYAEAIRGLETAAKKVCHRYRIPQVVGTRAYYRGMRVRPGGAAAAGRALRKP